MKMNMILLSFFSLLWIIWSCLPIHAQNEEFSRGLDRYFSDLSSYVKLTDEQKEKTRAIIELNQKKQRSLFMKYREEHQKQGPPDMDLLRKEMQENQKYLYDQLGKVLSVKQMEAYKTYHDELRKKRMERMENQHRGNENRNKEIEDRD